MLVVDGDDGGVELMGGGRRHLGTGEEVEATFYPGCVAPEAGCAGSPRLSEGPRLE